MPEKDATQELDNVYIQDPDTGELTKFEGLENCPTLEPAEHEAPELEPGWISEDVIGRLTCTIKITAARLMEILKPIVYNFVEAVSALGGDIAWAQLYGNALIWAEVTHPEYIKILRRTKKTRIREKYRKRIVREYLKHKEANL